MRNKLIEIHYHGGTTICSFASCNVEDHIFEIQREKRTPGVFMSVFSWNWHLKCHLDGDGPLQRDRETLGKMLVVGPMQAPPEGDAQQVALRLQTSSHGKQSLEERVRLPQTTELIAFFTPFTHPLVSTMFLCLGRNRGASCAPETSRFYQPNTAGTPLHITCCALRKTTGVKTRKNTCIPAKNKKRKKNWHGREALPCPSLSVVPSSPCHRLQTSCPLQPPL